MHYLAIPYSGYRTSEVYCAGAYHPESIDTIWDDHKMDKWTKSRAIYHKNHKNRKYRGFTRVTMGQYRAQ